MHYKNDQIERYLEILHNYTKKPIEEIDVSKKANVVIVKTENLLPLITVIKSVKNVE